MGDISFEIGEPDSVLERQRIIKKEFRNILNGSPVFRNLSRIEQEQLLSDVYQTYGDRYPDKMMGVKDNKKAA